MMDARHSPDSLFLFSDSDFRFFESDCFGDEWLLLGSHRTAERCGATAGPQAQPRASRPAAADGAPCPPRAWGSRWQFTNMPSRCLHTEHSDCLSDIVRMCTVASRCGLGNIVWLCYDCAAFNAPCKAKATQIWRGTHFVAFNALGARAIHARIFWIQNRAVLICGCGLR